jgi:uncharacterized protein (DUF1330 family)
MASKDFTTESRAGGTRSRSDHHSTQSRAIVALSALVGFAAGAATVHGLHAQSQPPGYAVIELDVQQPEEFEKEFVPLATKAVTDQHGKFLAPPGPTTTIEGKPSKQAAVIEFESVDRAVATFGSAAYRDALKIGDRYARFQIFAVQDAER